MGTGFASDSNVLEKNKEKLKEPNRYTVIFHNDHYTTMEFVVFVLRKIFGLNEDAAYQIMLDVHKKGRGAVGNYSYDVAVTKVNQVHTLAKENEYPLKCSVEQI